MFDIADLSSEYRESVCSAYHKFVEGVAVKVVEHANQMVAEGLRGEDLHKKISVLVGNAAEAIAFADGDADENGEVSPENKAGHRFHLMDALDGDCGGIADSCDRPDGGYWMVTGEYDDRRLEYVPDED